MFGNDDAATIAVQLYCEATSTWIENGQGDDSVSGLSWQEGACATPEERICGYQLRIDPTAGPTAAVDDTQVNDVKFFCCDGYP